jgi:Amidohydrolase family
VLRGSAVEIVRKAVTPISFEQRVAQVRAVLREAREGGVTTIQDLTSGPQLRAYQYLHARGELDVRILLRPTLDMVAHVEPLGITQGFGDHWLKYIGYKAWVDGIMGGSSAMFFEPPESRLRPICRDVAPDAHRRAARRLVPRRTPQHRRSDRSGDEKSRLGVVRGTDQGHDYRRQAGRSRRVRYEPRRGGPHRAGATSQGACVVHDRRRQGGVRTAGAVRPAPRVLRSAASGVSRAALDKEAV